MTNLVSHYATGDGCDTAARVTSDSCCFKVGASATQRSDTTSTTATSKYMANIILAQAYALIFYNVTYFSKQESALIGKIEGSRCRIQKDKIIILWNEHEANTSLMMDMASLKVEFTEAIVPPLD